jgi:hypothetical protein
MASYLFHNRFFILLSGKRITQEHRQLLIKAKQLAESISMLTEELAKEEFEKVYLELVLINSA